MELMVAGVAVFTVVMFFGVIVLVKWRSMRAYRALGRAMPGRSPLLQTYVHCSESSREGAGSSGGLGLYDDEVVFARADGPIHILRADITGVVMTAKVELAEMGDAKPGDNGNVLSVDWTDNGHPRSLSWMISYQCAAWHALLDSKRR